MTVLGRSRSAAGLFSALRRPFGRIAAFSVLPAVSLVSNLVVLPVLSSRFGQPGWSSVLIGMSVGAAASVVCGLAWPMEGANLTARAGFDQRTALYRRSLGQRIRALAVVIPLVVGFCLLADPDMALVCVLSGIAISLNALSPTWFFIGVSRPSHSLIAEGGPRLVANLVSIGLVALLPLWTYPLALMAGMAATQALAWFFVRRDAGALAGGRAPVEDSALAPIGGRIPVLAIAARGAEAGYSYLAGPLIAIVAPPAYAVFAAVDKLGQSVGNVMSTVTQGLMAWIVEVDELRRRRLALAVAVAGTASALAFLALALGAPLLLGYIFAGTVEVGPLVAVAAGAIVAGNFFSKSLNYVLLVPLDMAALAYRSLLFGSVGGLPVVLAGAILYGGRGALVAAAVVPFCVLVFQLSAALRRSRATA